MYKFCELLVYFFRGFRFNNVSFFISCKNFRVPSFYQKLNLYSDVEELDKTLLDLDSQLNAVLFSTKGKYLFPVNLFALLMVEYQRVYRCKDIILPRKFFFLESNDYLFSFLSSRYKLKVLLPIEFSFIFNMI